MKIKRRWPFIIASVIGLLLILFLLGPKPERPDFSSLVLHQYTGDLHMLEDSLVKSEAVMPLKPDNEARIIWATPYQKTAYSMVYLHGNGASQEEGDPIHEALANRYGCNLYLARLEDHGLEGDDLLLHIDPLKWMQSALDAIEIGKALGEKVILVSCSTGSTLALYLTATYPDLVEAQIMLSPNVDYFDPRSFMMAGPWGKHLFHTFYGDNFILMLFIFVIVRQVQGIIYFFKCFLGHSRINDGFQRDNPFDAVTGIPVLLCSPGCFPSIIFRT